MALYSDSPAYLAGQRSESQSLRVSLGFFLPAFHFPSMFPGITLANVPTKRNNVLGEILEMHVGEHPG